MDQKQMELKTKRAAPAALFVLDELDAARFLM
jgi:hypothetical protein